MDWGGDEMEVSLGGWVLGGEGKGKEEMGRGMKNESSSICSQPLVTFAS